MPSISELVVYGLEGTAHWRREKYDQFPEDSRNLDAATRLDKLAKDIETYEGSDLHHRLQELWQKAASVEDVSLTEIQSEMTRAIGFRSFPIDGEEFLEALIDRLAKHLQESLKIDTSAWDEVQLDSVTDPPTEFNDLTTEESVELIKDWFFENFEDPSYHTPREDGEFIYIWGGPYQARDIIGDVFSDLVSEEIIEAAIEAVQASGTFDWAPADQRVQPPEDYGEPPIVYTDTAELHQRMLERIGALEEALANLSRPGVGHNHPPEPIEDEPLDASDHRALVESISVLKSHSAEPTDEPSTALEAANILDRMSKKVSAYFAQKGDLFVTEAVKAFGAETGKLLPRLALWVLVGQALVNASGAAFAWLHSLPWPF